MIYFLNDVYQGNPIPPYVPDPPLRPRPIRPFPPLPPPSRPPITTTERNTDPDNSISTEAPVGGGSQDIFRADTIIAFNAILVLINILFH